MNIAIIGASNNTTKYGNKAVRAYTTMGWTVFPVNPKEKQINGIDAYKNLLRIPYKIDRFSMYVPPEIGIKLVNQLKKAAAKEVWLNPGAESNELIEALNKAGIKPILQCSIRGIGVDPNKI